MAVEALIIGPVMVQPKFREKLHETLAGFMNAVQTEDGGLESVGLMGPSSVSVSDETRYDDAYDLPPAEKVVANPFVEISSTSLTTESDANSSPTVSSATQKLVSQMPSEFIRSSRHTLIRRHLITYQDDRGSNSNGTKGPDEDHFGV